MAKVTPLTAKMVETPQATPQAATAPRAARQAPKVKIVPLQVRLPQDEVKLIKRAALDQDFKTVSDFMLACFHAYMAGQHVSD